MAFRLALLSTFAVAASAASAAEWRNRTVYQLLTDRFGVTSGSPSCPDLSDYCGGSFQGIINHLDYIQGMGFDAVWISPVVKNTPGGYHGYWASNLDEINPYFGSSADLLAVSAALHARGMYLMVDVVANHMGDGDISTFSPFSNASFYHDCSNCPSGCSVTDYNDETQMEHCRLAGLLDLNQTDAQSGPATGLLLAWIRDLVQTYAVDGLRIDTIPYVPASFWSRFSEAAGVYTVGEIDMGNVQWVASYQGAIDGTLSYPLYFSLVDVFGRQASMNEIQSTLQAYATSFKDLSVLGVFESNHDNPRFLNVRDDVVAYKNHLLFVYLSIGIPIGYYGSEQGFKGGNDPACREILWPTGYSLSTDLATFITQVIGWRKRFALWTQPQVQRYSDTSFYAYTRGNVFVATTNVGTNGATEARTITYHPYSNGQVLCNLFNCAGDCVTVQGGAFEVTLGLGLPKVYVPQAQCA